MSKMNVRNRFSFILVLFKTYVLVKIFRDIPHLYKNQVQNSSKLWSLQSLKWYQIFDAQTILSPH